MKLGDTVYIVRAGSYATEAEVVYLGKHHFTAGGFTFHKSEPGEPHVGMHYRIGKAYESQKTYQEWLDRCHAWDRLRYSMTQMTTPPDHLSTREIQDFIELCKGKIQPL